MTRPRLILTAVVALAIHASTSLAQRAAPRVLATFSGDSIEEFSVAPSGRFVMYATKAQLRMFDVASRTSWDLAPGPAEELAWAISGDRVAWSRYNPGTKDAYVWSMPLDARTGKARGAPQRVTRGRSFMPALSTNGRMIAFVSIDSVKKKNSLAIAPVTGGPERVVASNYEFEGIGWSADGKSLYVNGELPKPATFGLVKLAIDGSSRTVVPSTTDALTIGATANRRYFIAVKSGTTTMVRPGDRLTIFDTTGRVVGQVALPAGPVHGLPGMIGDSALVWITKSSHSVLEVRPTIGGNATRLGNLGESATLPAWSPDGKHIAFQVNSGGKRAVGVMNADGTNPRIFREIDIPANEPAMQWSPDSRMLALRSADRNVLSTLDIASGTVRQVIEDSIGGWQWQSDSKALIYRNRRMPGASIEQVTLSGQRKTLLDWPLPNGFGNWTFVGDTSVFSAQGYQGVAEFKSFGTGATRRIASLPSNWDFIRPTRSHDGQWLAAQIEERLPNNRYQQVKIGLLNLSTGAVRAIDVPFSWIPGNGASWPKFMSGDSAVLVFGRRPGEADIKLFKVPLNGGPSTVFADIGTAPGPREAFSASFSPDGRSVVYSTYPKQPTVSLVLIDLKAVLAADARKPSR